ncbi:hypothetical protein [Micromonospora sp. NPDC049679]
MPASSSAITARRIGTVSGRNVGRAEVIAAMPEATDTDTVRM